MEFRPALCIARPLIPVPYSRWGLRGFLGRANPDMSLISMFSAFGGVTLLVLPGAWLAYGLRLPGATARTRLALAAVLSPPVIVAQFYPLRWVGLSFQQTALALAVLNLAALIPVYRRRSWPARPTISALLAWALPMLLVGGYLAIWTGDPQVRGNWGHAWTHSGMTYMIANGQLRPEEQYLAGVALAYPWGGAVVQAVLSWLVDSAPGSSFMLSNLATLVGTIALVAELIAALSGGRVAQVAGSLLLCFGINFLGPIGEKVLPLSLQRRFPILGDSRYEIWFRKFGVFNQNGVAMALCVAAALVVVDLVSRGWDWSRIALISVLLFAVAVYYPILWPAVAIPVGAALLIAAAKWKWGTEPSSIRMMAALVLACALSLAAQLVWTRVVFIDAVDDPKLSIGTFWFMKLKVATAAVVLFPLWTTACVGLRSLYRTHRDLLVLLLLAFAGNMVLYVGLRLAGGGEYKFMFLCALFLAPCSAIGVQVLMRRAPRAEPALLAFLALVIALPPTYFRLQAGPNATNPPLMDFSRFDSRLRPGQRGAVLFDAIRSTTPVDAVLVSLWQPFDLVTPTRRALYVLASPKFIQGLGVDATGLLKLFRGYSTEVVEIRRQNLRNLYNAGDDAARAAALATIQASLHRTLVIVVRLPEDAPLDRWLSTLPARRIAGSDSEAAWLLEAQPKPVGLALSSRASLHGS